MKREHSEMTGEGVETGNNDEIDDVDDRVDKVPPYDAAQEPLPQNAVFTPEYAKLTAAIQNVVDMVAEPLRQSEYRNAVISGLLDEITNRTQSHFPEKVRIALVGDMKSGKSSVINSLLSVGTIARQGDAGSSCTWVVNEFGYLFPNQTHTFAAEVYFFTQDERHEIIAALLASFYRASPKDQDFAEGTKDSDQNVEDYGIMRTTVTAFRALFNDHEEFDSDKAAHEFLSSAQSEDDEYILSMLRDWSDALIARSLGSDPCIYMGNNTTQGLTWDLAPYLYTVEEREGEPIISVWPFVSYIKYGLDCPLLKNNVSLLDLPGLSDANQTRVKNAKEYLRTCTHYMIVAEIGRAADDKFIRDHLSRGFTTRGSGRTLLVLTHADTMDEATEVQATRKDQQQLDKLIQDMKTLERKKTELFGRIKSSKGPERYKYMEAKDEVASQLRAKTMKHQELRIAIRSKNVARLMQEVYADLTPDPLPLPVFCVGNHAYRKHQAGYAIDDPSPPSLSVQGTNIPSLRSHLFLAPAEGRVNDTKHQVNAQVPTLLNTFALYVAKTHMARRDEVEKFVLEPQESIKECIGNIFQKLKDSAEKAVLDPLRSVEHNFNEEARIMCRGWAQRNSTAIHLAFLKSDGVRKAKGRGAGLISWNDDLIGICSGVVRHYFADFTYHHQRTLLKPITKEVHGMLATMSGSIRSDPQVTLMALKPFLDYIHSENANITPLVNQTLNSLRRELGQINSDASSDTPKNPIVRAMVPIYEATRNIKGGRGAPKLRQQKLEGDVCRMGDGVWMKAHDFLRDDLYEMFDKHKEELTCVLRDFFIGIHQKFDMMCADKELEDAEEAAIREQLGAQLKLARAILEEEVRPAYAACFERD